MTLALPKEMLQTLRCVRPAGQIAQLPQYRSASAIVSTRKRLGDWEKVHTLTSDHGKEFAEMLQLKFYFAHPYAAWERGTNENTNGLLLQYFPKKSDFQSTSNKDVEQAMSKLNFRPRKSLRFKTLFEVFYYTEVALKGDIGELETSPVTNGLWENWPEHSLIYESKKQET